MHVAKKAHTPIQRILLQFYLKIAPHAIHVRNREREEKPSLKNLTIDVGAANKKEEIGRAHV